MNNLKIAGLWDRFAGKFVDGLLFLPFLFLRPWLKSHEGMAAAIVTGIFLLLNNVYEIYFHGRWGQTLGKMAVNTRVLTTNGKKISWSQAFARLSVTIGFSLCFIVFELVLYSTGGTLKGSKTFASITALSGIWRLGDALTLLFNKANRSLHDFIAGTIVIKEKWSGDISPTEETNDLVEVFSTTDVNQVAFVKSLLGGSGIKYVVLGDDHLGHGGFMGALSLPAKFLVPAEQVTDAKALLKDLL